MKSESRAIALTMLIGGIGTRLFTRTRQAEMPCNDYSYRSVQADRPVHLLAGVPRAGCCGALWLAGGPPGSPALGNWTGGAGWPGCCGVTALHAWVGRYSKDCGLNVSLPDCGVIWCCRSGGVM